MAHYESILVCQGCGIRRLFNHNPYICPRCGSRAEVKAGKYIKLGVWYKPSTWFTYKIVLKGE